MSEENQREEGVEPREVQMEEMFSAVTDSVKQGAGLVMDSIGAVFKYSWMGFQYAGGDIKQFSDKALQKVQKRTETEEAV